MPTHTGTYTIYDLLEVQRQTIDEFDETKVWEVLRAEIAAHNRVFQDMASSLMVTTTERIFTFGAGDNLEMMELDEFGRTPAQKVRPEVGTFNLPLRGYGTALGWTRQFMLQRTPADLAQHYLEIEKADIRLLYRLIRRALFVPTNYTVRDFLIDNAEMRVVRLLNGDGMPIPMGPEGQTFDPDTHTHYLANNGWNEAVIDAAVATVREHGHMGNLRISINANNQPNIEGLDKFEPATLPLLRYGQNETIAAIALDNSQNDDNRVIGVWGGKYEVWTRPWVPANYVYVYDSNGPKPLAMRVPVQPNLRGLRLVANIDLYPLRAEYHEHQLGVGVGERTNGAIAFMGGSTYTAPEGLN